MNSTLKYLLDKIFSAFKDVLPIIIIIAFFQLFVIQKPFPNLPETLFGVLLVIAGLFLFIMGLESALFPIGEQMAIQFAKKGSVFWVVFFGFALGFSTTIAEPALTVIAGKAGEMASNSGVFDHGALSKEGYVLGLRLTIALSVGFAIAMGVLRILKDWSLPFFIIFGYIFIILATVFAPPEIIGLAYDSGGITTSTITVPLVTALGLGLASSIRGRNPILDGFGLIAFASLTPILFVMLFGIFVYGTGA
ncbi:MAG: hypothetical protein COV66_15000 [Nitrospinae bacterium CG11_big_fil_rev_8_21_14_0_20_45_15]|nr:MAG: hypothetical protein COV66_15000 [Nitrospinae bacterium CG11_big_fil_rev_8_21_14_0_20_45_15]